MILQDLYTNDINRHLNPAVSATKLDPRTAKIEIDEYVFTDEIISGLYRILNAIRNNQSYEHIGIWIDGYYGSGKSHFLKYLDYCFDPAYRKDALARLVDEVSLIDLDDLKHDKHNLQALSDAKDNMPEIARWLENKSEVETRIFNLETSHDLIKGQKNSFLQVFWGEFNKQRGLNPHNLAMAQFLEKPLMELGVFEEFKRRMAEQGGDWSKPEKAAQIFVWKRKKVFDIVHDLAPELDTDSIAKAIDGNQLPMTIEFFGKELASWIATKGENYRLIMLADEVSQFINKEKDRYLNLQEIITYLSEVCHNQVWIACTAQQDLSEILDDCNIGEEKDHEGKIKGRFEVKVSLKGTKPEVITQKRLLDKKPQVKPALKKLYQQEHDGFSIRFPLPQSYKAYESEDEFVDYYPFVPYQFRLIMQVFDNFLYLGYVAKEVKGNERSIIKVAHSTAKANADEPLGKLISFDELYNNMFEEGLMSRGQKAIENAIKMANDYTPNPTLAKRVANVLFMVCNISDNNKLNFPANLTNLTILLVKDFTTPFLDIRDDVKKVVDYFCDNNIIREEKGKEGMEPYYIFFSEEEMKVADLIKNQDIDSTLQAEELRDIFHKYFDITPKAQFMSRSFSLGTSIKGRSFLGNNPDVVVEFDMDNDTVADLIMRNNSNRLLFLVGPKLNENSRLLGDFRWYCKVQRYMKTVAVNDENAKVRGEFSKRASALYDTSIRPGLERILDECVVMTGPAEVVKPEVTSKKGKERYRNAIQAQLESMYPLAHLVSSPSIPHDTAALRVAINRPVNTGDYDGVGAVLSTPEKEVENYLERQVLEVNAADVVGHFAKGQYGWDKIATLYIINELVRRHRRDYSYSNNPTVSTSTITAHLVDETNKFTIRKGKAISQELVNNFIAAWKKVFGPAASFSSSDSTQIYNTARGAERDLALGSIISRYHQKLERELKPYQFSNPVSDALALFESWMAEQKIENFFNLVIKDADKGKLMIDAVKKMNQFFDTQLPIFEKVVKFVSDNRDNFRFLSEDLQPLVVDLQGLQSSLWPISIKDYKQKMEELERALSEVRKQVRTQITDEYNKTFDQLEQYADSLNVSRSVIADRAKTIESATHPNNILVLRDNLDTNDLYRQQAERILAAQQKANEKDKETDKDKDKDKDTGNDSDTTEVREPKHAFVKLVTRSAAPLSSETDIDRYLVSIKAQLMKHLDGDTIITVQ